MESVVPPSMKAYYENFHFSPAVVDGDTVRCSGVIGVGEDGKASDDPEAQFTTAFEGVQMVLEAAGASLADITEMTTFHVGLNKNIAEFMKVKDRFIAEPYPAWTAIGVVELAFPGALVEIRVNARKR